MMTRCSAKTPTLCFGLIAACVLLRGVSAQEPPEPVGINYAPDGVAAQSSEYNNGQFPADLGLDGSLDNFTHTLTGAEAPDPAWWEVDLGLDLEIGLVRIYNRGGGCCQARLRDLNVTITDSLDQVVFDYEAATGELINAENALGGGMLDVGPAFIDVEVQTLAGATVIGQVVRVSRLPDEDLSGTMGGGNADEGTVLSLGEVEIYGPQPGYLPPSLEEVEGLERVVPDTAVYLDAVDERAALGNWEPYTGVLGNSFFLIESNTFADADFDAQRYGVVFQPVGGGPNSEGEAFFDDEGFPYMEAINNYRQNGNPGRVAGDTRPGAVNFITGGEGSPNEFEPFQSDDRWDSLERAGRFGTIQTFYLAGACPDTEVEGYGQTPRSLAFDAVNGRVEEGDLLGNTEITRFGGDLAGLSNGNFVAVVEDRSLLHALDRVSSAVIVDPDGNIVADTFVTGPGDIWSNVAAYDEGFCVRQGGILRFYDNEGEFIHELDQATGLEDAEGNPVDFDRGRGDGTRIASHINSQYVFLSGLLFVDGAQTQDVYIAAYDAHSPELVAFTNVNELTPALGGSDDVIFRGGADRRVGVASDALNRVAVSWEVSIPGLGAEQSVARVLAFDGAEFSYLTPSFFVFVNHNKEPFDELGVDTPIRAFRPHVSMTTREILVAGKGEINLENLPEDGADSPGEINFYTVFSHPDPQDDPTPAVEPGVCQPEGTAFKRGDADGNGMLELTDAVNALDFQFIGSFAPTCLDALDWDDSGTLEVTDPIGSLTLLFLGGAPAPAPGHETCGVDPTDDDLTCETYEGCN